MVMKCAANVRKENTKKEKINLNEDTTKNSEITLIFPEGSYSVWKKDITKLRKEIGCTEWDNVSWIGANISINTMFYKTAIKLGIETDGPEDILTIVGNVTDAEISQVLKLIDICRRQCNGVVKINLHYPCTE